METKSQTGYKNNADSALTERTLFDTIGDELKRARLAKNLTIETVSHDLNIRPVYINALENNETGNFPAAVYGIAFLRSYAAYLGLDGDVLVKQYKEKNKTDTNITADFPIHADSPVIPDKRVLGTAGIVFALLIAAGITIAHFNNAVSENEETSLTEITNSETSAPAQTDAAVEEKVEEINKALSEVLKTDAVKTIVETEKPIQNYPEITGERFGVEENARIVLVARDEVWISVSNSAGIVFNRVLKKGDAYFVPVEEKNLLLKTGNAIALNVYADHILKGPLSKDKKVQNNVKLDADSWQKK